MNDGAPSERNLGAWDPVAPQALSSILAGLPATWWLAGGRALEAFVGRTWRAHGDTDVGVFRQNLAAVRRALSAWDPWCADPPGRLRPWRDGEVLAPQIHDVWVRERPGTAWRFQLVIDDREGSQWVYRRDSRVRLPVGRLTWEADGVRVVSPEVQLLYKSKGLRAKDEQDFEQTLPFLDPSRRTWLADALARAHPAHPWRDRLGPA